MWLISVMNKCQVRIRDVYETNRSVGKCLCSESRAKLDSQAGDKKCMQQVNYKHNSTRLT